MIIPLQITGHGVELSEEVRDEITERANNLDRFYDRIMRCRVVVDEPKKHPHAGKLYSVHIVMTVPGGEVVTKREQNDDLFVAMRDAFDAAQRMLEDFSREQRGDVKSHEKQPRGRISVIFPDQGYGFLVSPEGYDVYFHENSVINRNFEKLSVGMEVSYTEEMGDKGPQASTVIVL
ncbi:MAG: Cold shock protein 2 [Syntrophus sp. PtaU1.Bin208]|nr:MAG: Cold shock protein 2 [Syntrophus sp. PtaU1.Bin208]